MSWAISHFHQRRRKTHRSRPPRPVPWHHHIGKLGLEAYYEPQLHGIPGMQEVEKDAMGNIIRVLNNTPAQAGQTLAAMDIRMQQKSR